MRSQERVFIPLVEDLPEPVIALDEQESVRYCPTPGEALLPDLASDPAGSSVWPGPRPHAPGVTA